MDTVLDSKFLFYFTSRFAKSVRAVDSMYGF